MKKLAIIITVFLFISACTNEPRISLQDIRKAFADNSLHLVNENKQTKYFVLNRTKATTYELDNGEDISFYLFKSESKREKGLENFNKQKEKYDMQIPSIYEVENILILYWYHGETGSATQYDKQIQAAVDSLSATEPTIKPDTEPVNPQCEGCGMTADEASEEHVGIDGELQLNVELTTDGFKLAYVDEPGFYAGQTLVSAPIEGVSYAVHIIRRGTDGPEGKFRRDAVVVNPITAEYRIYPLYLISVDDWYGADSLAIAYGFIDDRHIVYVSAVNDDNRAGGYYYRIEKLNILTGETTIIFPEIPDLQLDDHYAPGWLNKKKDTLVLNGYRSGQLWSFNLITGEIIQPQPKFQHSWPFYLTVVSPDGELFWYSDYEMGQYRLHDRMGKQLAEVEFGKGYNQYPAFLWNPDSQYAVIQDTREQNKDHIIDDDGESYIIAPNRIRLFDRLGELKHTLQLDSGTGRYIEVAGWLDDSDGVVLIHEYELERDGQSATSKINPSYRLLDLKTGKINDLQMNTDMSMLIGSVPAQPSHSNSFGADRQIYLINKEKKLVSILAENGVWLPKQANERVAWVTNVWGLEESVLHVFDQQTGQISQHKLGYMNTDIHFLGDAWLVWGDMQYSQYLD